MTKFDDEYWNLCQSALWVEFRNQAYVEIHGAEDADGYNALHWYPEVDQPLKHADVSELTEALKSNALVACGYHVDDPNVIKDIPPLSWYHIDLRPPHAFDTRNRDQELWNNVRLKRRDIMRIWQRPAPPTSKAWYDWDEIRKIYEDVIGIDATLSQNQTILEIQARFSRALGKQPPSRSKLQTKLKEWRWQAR